MNHSYFSDRISAFKDQELPPYEQAALAKHLEDCPECQATLLELEKLDGLIEQQSLLGGGDYWERQAQAIEEKLGAAPVTDIRSSARGSGLFWKWASVAASVAVLTFIGLHQSDIFQDEKLIPREATPAMVEDTATDRGLPDSLAGPEGEKGEGEVEGRDESGPDRASQAAEVSRSAATRLIQQPMPVRLASPDSLAHLDLPTIDTATHGPTETMPQAEKARIQPRSSLQAEKQNTQTVDMVDMVAAPAENIIHSTLGDAEQHRRAVDSLSRLLLSYGKRRGIVEPPEPSDSADSEKSQLEPQSVDQLEAELLRASFYLAGLSTDSAEVRRSTELIEGVATDKKAVNRSLAEQYLRQLKEASDTAAPAKK